MSAFVGKREAPLPAELLYLPLTDEALIEQHLITSERKCSPDTLFLNDVLCISIGSQAADKGTQLNYEVLSEAVSAVRCSVPLGTNWKKRIDEDYESRK